MQEVNELLGYPYMIEGTVMHGDARGRTLGFPTANIRFSPTTRLPIEGVYVCESQGYASYRADSERVEVLANVFPVFLFAVAALVSLTTMPRLSNCLAAACRYCF